MNLHDLAPWLAPLLATIVCVAIPGLIRAAISGEFAEARNQEAARMAAHNVDEASHPRLRVVTEFEDRMEQSFRDLRQEFREEMAKLSEQIDDLKKGLAPRETRTANRKKGNR